MNIAYLNLAEAAYAEAVARTPTNRSSKAELYALAARWGFLGAPAMARAVSKWAEDAPKLPGSLLP